MSNTEDIRKIMDLMKTTENKDNTKASKRSKRSKPAKPANMLTEDFNDAVDAPGVNTKVEIEFTGENQAEVEVYADGMEEVKRLVDLAGIFHKEKVDAMGMNVIDPTGDIAIPSGEVGFEPGIDDAPMDPSMDADMGIDAPIDSMDVDMGIDDAPIDPSMDADMGIDAPIDSMDVDMGMDDASIDDMDVDMGIDAPIDDMDADMGMDMPTGGPDVPATLDDTPEIEFNMDPEVEGIGEANFINARFDHGVPNENLGQEQFHMDVHNFSGGASKPVRFVPARSGDNPMIDPVTKKGLKEYMAELVEDLEKKDLNEDVKPDSVEEFVAKTFDITRKDAQTAQALEKAAEELSNNPRDLVGKSPEQIAALVSTDDKVSQTGGLNQAEESDMEKNVADYGEEFDEAKRNYSFKQSVLPFQGLTGTQRLHRNALRKAKSSFRR